MNIPVTLRVAEKADLPEILRLYAHIRDVEAVSRVVTGAIAVVSCLGAPLLQTFRTEGRVNTYGMPRIVAAMRKHGVRRIIAMSSNGSGNSLHRMSAMMRFGMSTVMHGVLADMNALEEILRDSQFDWTVVRPVNLKDSPSAGKLIVDRPGDIKANDWVSRVDVSAFMLASLGDPTTIRRVLFLSESH